MDYVFISVSFLHDVGSATVVKISARALSVNNIGDAGGREMGVRGGGGVGGGGGGRGGRGGGGGGGGAGAGRIGMIRDKRRAMLAMQMHGSMLS